jgi:hypothetical protein
MECLLSAWDPMGVELAVDDLGYHEGINRSDYQDQAWQLQLTIAPASGHQLVAASITARAWLERIASSEPWINDRWYGRRTGTQAEDAPGIIAGLMRRLA